MSADLVAARLLRQLLAGEVDVATARSNWPTDKLSEPSAHSFLGYFSDGLDGRGSRSPEVDQVVANLASLLEQGGARWNAAHEGWESPAGLVDSPRPATDVLKRAIASYLAFRRTCTERELSTGQVNFADADREAGQLSGSMKFLFGVRDLEPDEHAVLFAPTGAVSRELLIGLHWRIECVGVFRWALGDLPAIPAPGDRFDYDLIHQFLPMTPEMAAGALQSARLRPLEELMKARARWRREVQECVTKANEDPADNASQLCRSRALERYRALLWLLNPAYPSLDQVNSMVSKQSQDEVGQDEVDSLPAWAQQLADEYSTKTVSTFIVSGAVFDVHPIRTASGSLTFSSLKEFFAQHLFAVRDHVVFYDRSSGIRAATPETKDDLAEFLGSYDAQHGTEFSKVPPRDPGRALQLLENYMIMRLGKGKSIALVVGFAETIAPAGALSSLSPEDRFALATFARWASEPQFLNGDLTIVFVVENLAEFAPSIQRNPYASSIEIPPPSEKERRAFIAWMLDGKELHSRSDVLALPTQTAGFSRLQLHRLLTRALDDGQRITPETLSAVRRSPPVTDVAREHGKTATVRISAKSVLDAEGNTLLQCQMVVEAHGYEPIAEHFELRSGDGAVTLKKELRPRRS